GLALIPSEPVKETKETPLGEVVEVPSYESYLEGKIRQMGDEYYQKGLEYTAKYDPLNKKSNPLLVARSYFDLCCDADPTKPRGYLANAIVSFHNTEAQQAYRYLIEGLKRVKTAEDLNIDKSSFFKDQDDFRMMYDQATVFARALTGKTELAGNI